MERLLLNSGGSKVKDGCWERENNNFKFDKDYPYGYPWPPRYYTCSFCQREFRSAQALGGHMNIHRRDRARLRDLSPTNNIINNNNNNPSLSSNDSDQNPNPNPNPNPNSIISFSSSLSSPSSFPTTINNTHQSYSLVSLSLSSIPPPINDGKQHHPSHLEIENRKVVDDDFHYHNKDHEVRVLRNNNTSSTKEVVRLDLELCLGEAKEDLDLELRLGVN